jgi:RecB family endonuclease NucS
MELYRAEADNLIRVPETDFQQEATLENHLIKADGLEIGGVEVFYIVQQGSPEDGGVFDILGVDEAGDVIIVELKRDKSPREIVSQALEYASGIRRESYEQLNERYRAFAGIDRVTDEAEFESLP